MKKTWSLVFLIFNLMPLSAMEQIGLSLESKQIDFINDSDYPAAIQIKSEPKKEIQKLAELEELEQGYYELRSKKTFSLNSLNVPLHIKIALRYTSNGKKRIIDLGSSVIYTNTKVFIKDCIDDEVKEWVAQQPQEYFK